MNQKQLSYFLEVYRCCNIQAAADKLYLTCPRCPKNGLKKSSNGSLCISTSCTFEFCRYLICTTQGSALSAATVRSTGCAVTVVAGAEFRTLFATEMPAPVAIIVQTQSKKVLFISFNNLVYSTCKVNV